jgi:hypothetical protein
MHNFLVQNFIPIGYNSLLDNFKELMKAITGLLDDNFM